MDLCYTNAPSSPHSSLPWPQPFCTKISQGTPGNDPKRAHSESLVFVYCIKKMKKGKKAGQEKGGWKCKVCFGVPIHTSLFLFPHRRSQKAGSHSSEGRRPRGRGKARAIFHPVIKAADVTGTDSALPSSHQREQHLVSLCC